MIPLYMLAKKLRKGPPAYTRCESNVFPAWTKKRCNGWTMAERRIPYHEGDIQLVEYIELFDSANNLKPAHTIPNLEYQEAA